MWYLITGLLILVWILIWVYYTALILLWFWKFLKEIPQRKSREECLKDKGVEDNTSFHE
tara:strand:+ start:30 stop:206 length:177 start_codon:yes stop_codon:yes gene_type:complete